MVPSIYFSSTLGRHSKNKILNSDLDILDVSLFREYNESTVKENKIIAIFKNLSLMFKEKVFILSVLALANLFFILTGVQYWGSDYLGDVLKVQDESDINLSFIIVCVSSPTLGVIVGGVVSSKIGGYESKHSILLCLICGALAGGFSIPVPFVDTIIPFTIYLWLVLFFGGAIVPPITGIIISSLPIKLRGLGNSITNVFSNLLGYLPAPYIYGVIYENTKDTQKRMAFTCLMYYSLLGFILLSLATYFRYKNFNDKKPENEPKPSLNYKDIIYAESVAKMFGTFIDDREYEDDSNDVGEPFQYKPYREEEPRETEQPGTLVTPVFLGDGNIDYLKDSKSSYIYNNDESMFGKQKKINDHLTNDLIAPQTMIDNAPQLKNSLIPDSFKSL